MILCFVNSNLQKFDSNFQKLLFLSIYGNYTFLLNATGGVGVSPTPPAASADYSKNSGISIAADSPVANSSAIWVEVDADLYYGQTGKGKLRGIVLQVYLFHGSLRTLVQFQLEKV